MDLEDSIQRRIDRLAGNKRSNDGRDSEELPSSDSEVSSTHDLRQLVVTAIQEGASDIHLVAYYPPTLRILGCMKAVEGASPMTPSDVQGIFQSITTQEQRLVFQHELELDFQYNLSKLARLRVNACLQQGSISMSFRIIPVGVPTFEELGLPEVCRKLAMEHHGLVLVTGPTGVGKTTTMAAMINYVNHQADRKIITIEDPIEYVYNRGKSMIIQRNLGDDTRSFAEGVKRALRQDPNVVLIGEMRDLETISAALTAAETGHLVLATLHTLGAAATVDRIVDVFPNGQASQIRVQLALTLKGVISQILLPRADGTGRVAAFEIMIGTPAIRTLMRDGKSHQIEGIVEMSSNQGMYTLTQDVRRLAKEGLITAEIAEAVIGKQP
ncbi:type IV pilus twitching motility protein PilT [Chloroflexota bacterium]